MLKEILALIVGIGIVVFGSHHKRTDFSAKPSYLVPPKDLKFFSLGYDEILADGLWLRVIQDFDYCGQTAAVQPKSPSSGVAPVNPDFIPEKCVNGWVYHMVDSVTELAPKFRMAYSSGGVMLSTVIHDIAGASAIFDKGSARFPTNWQILYYASYHALASENNNEKAADLLVKAAKNGAPPWTYALAAKLYTRVGKALFAKAVLTEIIQDQDERWVPSLKKRLEEVELEIKAASAQESKQ